MSTTATSGVAKALSATFEYNGVLTDPELPLTLTITRVQDSEVVLTTDTVNHPSVGVFTYTWTPPSVDTATEYVVTWDPSGDDVSASEVCTVYPSTLGTWCTVEFVYGMTGKTVTAETLILASSIIDTHTGADTEMPEDSITTRDRRHLAKATAWQAVWTAPRVDLIVERENFERMSSDTQTIERGDRSDHMLAPLARRELMNLSWIGTRSVRVPPASSRVNRSNFLNEESDAYGVWRPL